MEPKGLDKHLLAGLDDRERGFSRPVEFEQAGGLYRAMLRYEAVRVTTDWNAAQDVALLTLVQALQARGYRQLKTQMSFRDGVYLGSQELWIDYPDPPQLEPGSPGLLARLLRWLHIPASNE
ncbi:MAG TPA: hypothetical protein VKP13_05815 [Nitrospira sp.]|nr:hypothetical protein [Nitrospira sp.]